MKFTPRTEDEIADSRLLKKRDLRLRDSAFDKDSKAGNQMIELKIRVSNGNGETRVLGDYLLEKRPDKLLHAARACGIEEKYKTGSVPAVDFRGKRGRLKLAVEKGKNGYPDKNVIADYICDTVREGSGFLTV